MTFIALGFVLYCCLHSVFITLNYLIVQEVKMIKSVIQLNLWSRSIKGVLSPDRALHSCSPIHSVLSSLFVYSLMMASSINLLLPSLLFPHTISSIVSINKQIPSHTIPHPVPFLNCINLQNSPCFLYSSQDLFVWHLILPLNIFHPPPSSNLKSLQSTLILLPLLLLF